MCEHPEDKVTTEYLNDQVGGDHYQIKYQHWDWVQESGIGYLVGNATKYLIRWRKKNGIQDLMKAKSYLEKIIATRHLPNADWHYREATYRTGVLLDKFIEHNQIPQEEADIIRDLSGACPLHMVNLALRRLDTFIWRVKHSEK